MRSDKQFSLLDSSKWRGSLDYERCNLFSMSETVRIRGITRATRSECGYLKARLSRVTIEITSRVIVVAAHNSSGNSGNGGGTYACLVPPDTHEISNWRIVDFNGARGKIRARTHERTLDSRSGIERERVFTSFSASPPRIYTCSPIWRLRERENSRLSCKIEF